MFESFDNYQEPEAQNPFSLSIGDLMAALLLIFILLLASTLLRLQDDIEIAERYTAVKEDIYDSLKMEFVKEINSGKLTIHKENLMIRFSPELKFATDETILTKDFKQILADFFPRYISIITQLQFKNKIEEIRIEGHTDNQASYIYNMQLSQARTRSVLAFVLDSTNYNSKHRDWVQQNLTANGLSYSKPIADNNTIQGRKQNRRVEFKLRTDADKQLEEMWKSK